MKSKKCNHTIGLFYNIYDGYLTTIDELEQELKLYKSKFELKDFADFKKNVCMDRFIYCPYCGEKLDWKKMCKVKE